MPIYRDKQNDYEMIEKFIDFLGRGMGFGENPMHALNDAIKRQVKERAPAIRFYSMLALEDT